MTLYSLASRYVGIQEIAGEKNHPLISWWLSLCSFDIHSPDEIPWCSAFLNGMAWELRLARSKSAAARSWLTIGTPLPIANAQVGFDVVVLKRGMAPQPGPDVIKAQGHVGCFGGVEGEDVLVLAGNQGNAVSLQRFPVSAVLGVRRLMM